MKPTKNRYLIIDVVCWMVAAITYVASAAGPATNVVTLFWTQLVQPVPYFVEVHQTTNMVDWGIITNLASTQTNLSLVIDRDLKAWKVRNVNSTNTTLVSDFSNVASTAWPLPSGNLGIRLGP